MSGDALGDRMKGYEQVTRTLLPRRSYSIVRVDGRAFHGYTKQLRKPVDPQFVEAMDATARALLLEVQGARLGYVQSDEISVLYTDFESHTSEPWFGGVIQKQASIAAATATCAFVQHRMTAFLGADRRPVAFDARVFTVPDATEAHNYFVWRQADAVRNSIQSQGHYHLGRKAMHGQTNDQVQELLFAKGVNWGALPDATKRGRVLVRVEVPGVVTVKGVEQQVMRSVWKVQPAPQFSKTEFLDTVIPKRD